MNSTPVIKVGAAALALAVLAGIVESVIVVVGFLDAGRLPAGAPGQLGARAVIYAGLLLLIGLTWRGSRPARWAVLILLGVVGLGSLVVPMVIELINGSGPIAALGGETSPWFAAARAAHILLVVAGSILLLSHRPAPAARPAQPVAG